jgi:ribosome-associated translation inhibitor RaiA
MEKHMELELQGKRVRLTQSLRVYIARRLTFALGQFRSRIRLIKAVLEDINGPRGGLDQQCRVMVRLGCGKEIRITGRGADLIAAVDHAADRASHAVGRELGRRQKRVARLKARDWCIG